VPPPSVYHAETREKRLYETLSGLTVFEAGDSVPVMEHLQASEINAADAVYTHLTAFGLTRTETAIYVDLLSEGDLNGYEIAKDLGVSRSNAYTSLAALVEKGAAWIIEGSPTRYRAVPPREFCEACIRGMEASKALLLEILPARREGTGSCVTIRGSARILDRLRALVADTRERLYLALPGPTLLLVADELSTLAGAGKKIVVISDLEFIREYSVDPRFAGVQLYSGSVRNDQIRAIADSLYVLTGDIGSGENASCLFSDQKNLVDLFKTALSNEIKLISLEASNGGLS